MTFECENGDKLNPKDWEILYETEFKEGVNRVYLTNRWRLPEQEQLFRVAYVKVQHTDD